MSEALAVPSASGGTRGLPPDGGGILDDRPGGMEGGIPEGPGTGAVGILVVLDTIGTLGGSLGSDAVLEPIEDLVCSALLVMDGGLDEGLDGGPPTLDGAPLPCQTRFSPTWIVGPSCAATDSN